MADTTLKELRLKFAADLTGLKSVKDAFAEMDAEAKAALDAQVEAINKVAKAQEKAAKDKIALDKQATEQFNKSMMGQLSNAPRFNPATSMISGMSESGRLANQQAEQSIRLAKEEAKQITANNTFKANEQAKYAAKKIVDEQDLADKTRKITLDSLRKTIEERNAILNAASKQRLGNAIGSITEAESTDRKKLLKSLREDMTERAKLQQEEFNLVERGLQQTRTREAERARIEETAARQRIERQAATNRQLLANETDFNERQRQNQLRGMRTSATSAFSEMPVAGRPAVAPIPRVPEDVRSGYDSLFARIGAINIEYRIWNSLINTVNESLRGIPRVGIELDSVKASLESTMGSTAAMNSALKALDVEAERTGINIGTLRDNFKGFQASTSLAGVSLDSTWRMFTNLNTVITGLHLSADKANHTFLAISQMFNKSKVQSEELVKQLGNLLPGAFASFAASMNITTQELSKQMKAGSVFAKDTMENFLQYMATKFTPAFNASIDNLNANTGRMQTSFTHLQEAIYEKTAPAMNSFVKSVTETIKSMTIFAQTGDNLANSLQTVIVAAMSLVAGHIAKLILAYAALETQAKATKVAMMWSNIEAAAVITFFVTLGETISATYNEFEKIKNARKDFYALYKEGLAVSEKELGLDTGKLKTEAELLKIKVDQNNAVIKLNESLEAQQAKFKDLPEQIKKDSGKELSLREQKNLEQAQAAMDTLKQQRDLVRNKVAKDLQQQDLDNAKKAHEDKIADEKDFQDKMILLSDKFPKSQKEAIDKALDTFKDQTAKKLKESQATIDKYKELAAKPVGSVKDTTLAQAKKEAEEAGKSIAEAKEAESRITENAIKKYNARKEAEANRASAIKFKGIKEEIKVDDQFLQTAANNAQEQIKLLNKSNDAKIYSFEEYARRKKEILAKDYNTEKEWLDKQLVLAQGTGKKDLVAIYSEKLKRLKTDFETQVGTTGAAGIIDTETTKNLQDYETNISMIHEKYRDILGLERDSNDVTSIKLEQLRKQIELEATEKGLQGDRARQTLIEFDTWQKAKNLKADFQTYQKSLTNADKAANDVLRRNNELKQAGQMTELQFMISNTKTKKEQIRLSEIEIDKMKQRLATASEGEKPAVQAQYDLAVQQLESLKLVANETGAMIEQSLGNAFEGAFNGLITKSMTARQAFASFTNSILADIAKIIAQEMRSQLLKAIIRPLAGAALSGLGNLAQSAGAIQFTNISSDPNMIGPMKPTFSSVNAKGGVYSGAGISAHSGTIVSSPTVFPFAKGVGLMGEAGPEAILPLKRNAQGKLGVAVDNAGHSGGNMYNITVNVESKQGESPSQFGDRAAQAIIRSIAKEEISNARRPGNTLNKSRFG